MKPDKKLVRVVDLETTGLTAEHEVVEIGAVDVDLDELTVAKVGAELVKPEKPITPENQAIHHISNGMVSMADDWATVWPKFLQPFRGSTDIIAFAAHRATFEAQWLTDHRRANKPLICTKKCALRVWSEAPDSSNQCLRYYLDLPVGDEGFPVHRAIPDAFVTAHLLIELLRKAPLEQLLQWSSEPMVYPVIGFGKHKGQKWTDLPADYLDWITAQKDMEADVKWNAQREIDRRAQQKERELNEAREKYVEVALKAVDMAIILPDLEAWYRNEAGRREKYGIIPGTDEYKEIIRACTDKKADLQKAAA